MNLRPAHLHPAGTQAGSLGSAAQAVMVSGGLESPEQGQALAQERLWVQGWGLLPLDLWGALLNYV